MSKTIRRSLFAAVAAAALLFGSTSKAGDIGSATLNIGGRKLTVDAKAATGVDIPGVVQTQFGGLTDDAAQPGDLLALAELTGPGIDSPIPLRTQPGRKFTLPPLQTVGDYTLQNVRLTDKDGNFLAPSDPTTCIVTVSGTLVPSVQVTQLSADDLRQRGISVDLRNYDVYDFNYTFAINGTNVVVPYPVLIDKRTHVVTPAPVAQPFPLPVPTKEAPPRWDPPGIVPFPLDDDASGDSFVPPQGDMLDKSPRQKHPSIPAALVIPNGFGVLHQFFSIILNVSNGAPAGSKIVLDGITATISTPTALRVAKVNPAVSIGEPVPVRLPNGDTVIVAGAMASADWSVEALRSGTHTVNLDIRATYKQDGQDDVPLHGKANAAIVVSDPRFQINFVHPDTVRANEPYTAYAFITNVSPQTQNVKLDRSAIPVCGNGFSNHICREAGADSLDLSFAPGQTISVPYKLTPDLTGHVFAAVPDTTNAIEGQVSLVMGVSAEGVPLSPATLVMPYHTQFVNQPLVDAYMPLLGLAYSLAVAPVTPKTATMPHLIRGDVWTRAQDIARAGERIFVTRQTLGSDNPDEDRAPIFNLSLDLLGNVEQVSRLASSADMHEWDQFRTMTADGLKAGAALGTELSRVGLANGRTITQFVSDFATATSHRSPYLFALAHGAAGSGSYAMTVSGASTSMSLTADNTSAVRKLAYGELVKFDSGSETGQLALVGRWTESLTVTVVPSTSSFTLDLIYPDTADGAKIRASLAVTATAGAPVTFRIDRGSRTIAVTGGTATSQVDTVPQTPLAIVHAAQDLHLDPAGHIVTVLFNRPITVSDVTPLSNAFKLETTIAAANRTFIRRNDPADTKHFYIPGAALQDDGRLLNISFDHALSTNAQYVVDVDPMTDALTASLMPATPVVPRIDNSGRGGVVVGKVLDGSGKPVVKNVVTLVANASNQYDTTDSNGEFFYEFVPRDLDLGIAGQYQVSTTVGIKVASLDGIIRSGGEVQNIVLQLLGRGTVQGKVTYSDGTPVANAPVVAASAFTELVEQFHGTHANDQGVYSLDDVPVGPLTLSAYDPKGNVTFASAEVKQPGEVVTQNLVIQKRDIAGFGVVHVTVRRSDQQDSTGTFVPVVGAHVGVWQAGYGLADGYTDSNGQFTFSKVPAGQIQILAADLTITRETISWPLDLKPDQTLDQTLVLHVPTATDLTQQSSTLSGIVQKDDPVSPGNPAYYSAVPNAQIHIEGLASVTADATGHYTFPNVPVSMQGKNVVTFFDPATGRKGSASLPTPLTAGTTNTMDLVLTSNEPQGFATFQVRLTSASGEPVDDYHVIWPGYPPTLFTSKGSGGVYELKLQVPVTIDVWATPGGVHPKYGEQVAHASMHAEFNGQLVVADLRLPGQGSVRALIRQYRRCDGSDPTCVAGYNAADGKASISYMKWDDAEQSMIMDEREPAVQSDPSSHFIVFDKVPVGAASVETVDNPGGYAAKDVAVKYEGDSPEVDLDMAAELSVSGRVVNYDLQTPVANAVVTLNALAAYVVRTGVDGSFKFAAIAPNQHLHIEADVMLNGIHRRGYVEAQAGSGTPVSGLVIVLREQANVSGIVVDANGAAVPLARYWARELAWPYTTFGSKEQPLFTGQDGKFVINNVFSGGVRITAELPNDDSVRADAQATIGFEGDDKTGIQLKLDPGGLAPVKVTVVDSMSASGFAPNAEVTLLRSGQPFDFGSADANGTITFNDVPVQYPGGGAATYSVIATSKAVGRAGRTDGVTLTANVPQQVTVPLKITGRMSGTLTDGDYDTPPPVVGAKIHATAAYFVDTASTGSAGDFTFNGLPEGTYRISTVDEDSGRRADIDNLSITSLLPNVDGIKLSLEKTGTATINVYLPNDQGASSGILAPLVGLKVSGSYYSREAQQIAPNGVTFAKMLTRSGAFYLDVVEQGGENRSMTRIPFSFAAGSLHSDVNIVLPTTGSVRVVVTDANGNAVPGALVSISSSGGGSATIFTDADGTKTVSGLGLGNVYVTATANGFSSAASAALNSHSQLLSVPVQLSGQRVTLTGKVTAELGGPSAGTRIVVDVSGTSSFAPVHIDTVTDANGNYRFDGIPAGGNSATISFFGPDGTTIGGKVVVSLPAGPLNNDITLDGTPPQVTVLDPANNANAVAPNAHLFVTFSEALQGAAATQFQLVASDDPNNYVALTTRATLNADHTYTVEITPGALLRSNTLYVFRILHGLADVAGNPIRNDITTTFRTVDYTEPKIIHTLPAISLPIDQGVQFQFQFNKSVSLDSLLTGVASIHMYRLAAPGGANGAEIALSQPAYAKTTAGTNDLTTIVVSPTGTAIDKGAFYRLTVAGVRDTAVPYNTQKDPQSFEYHSVDTVAPVTTIVSPVAAGAPLVEGKQYSIRVTIADQGTTTPSADIQYVDWLTSDGTTDTAVYRATTSPYTYTLTVAPGTKKVTLRAQAVDFSFNKTDLTTSATASFTWDVVANLPPQGVVVTPSQPTTYRKNRVTAAVTFTDEGVQATVHLAAVAKHADGTDYPLPDTAITPSANQNVLRSSEVATWPAATFGVDVPADAAEGQPLVLTATVTDTDKQVSAPATASVNILADANAPTISAITAPKAESSYTFVSGGANTFPITIQAKDAESGVAKIQLAYDGRTAELTASSYDAATQTYTFTGTGIVSRKNADTRIHVSATAVDYAGNVSAASNVDIIFKGVVNTAAAVAQWVTPLDGAALKAGDVIPHFKLRVHVIDKGSLVGVAFASSAFTAAPADIAPIGTDAYYETSIDNFTVPATPFVITATAKATDPANNVDLPITIDPVVIDSTTGRQVLSDTVVDATNVADYTGKSIIARGSATHLNFRVPVVLKNLIVIEGAQLSNSTEAKVDITVTDHFYVDGDSSINVNAKGYLGGWQQTDDHLTTNGASGKTISGGTGATNSASASYGGIGGEAAGTSNATYGSITNPVDFGSGGAGGATSSNAGGHGGGAVILHGGSATTDLGRIVLAGSVHADGESATGSMAGAGSGGSVNISARALVTGDSTRITANGGDDDARANGAAGAGGGRVAVSLRERFDVIDVSTLLESRGGRNLTSTEGATYTDGGAGTIFLARPDASTELIISSRDSRYTASTHATRGTPVAGPITFDKITVGPRALARLDDTYSGATVIDPTAMLLHVTDVPTLSLTGTTPAAGDIIQFSNLVTTSNATAVDGIDELRLITTVTADAVSPYGAHPASLTNAQVTALIPDTATLGAMTMKLRATSRSGRVVETAPVTFNVIANAPPAITQFDTIPATSAYQGNTITVAAAASDDAGAASLALTSSVGTVTAGTQTTDAASHVTSRSFSVTTPFTTPVGTAITLTLKASDGFPGRATIDQPKTITVVADTIKPTVSVTTNGATFNEGPSNVIFVTATAVDNETKVTAVSATLGTSTVQLAQDSSDPRIWRGSVPAPFVDATGAMPLTVTATDYAGNQGTGQTSVTIVKNNTPGAPTMAWLCGATGAIYRAGDTAKLRVLVTPAASTTIQKVEFYLDNSTVPIAAVPASGVTNGWEKVVTVPTYGDGVAVPVRAVATTTASATANIGTTFTVYSGPILDNVTQTIAATDLSYAAANLFIRNSTITLVGHHDFQRLIVLEGGKVTQQTGGTSSVDIKADAIFIACDAVIDVTAKGYGPGQTYPNETIATNNSGASHIGQGAYNTPGTTYGSVYQPQEAGSSNNSSTTARGGGVVRLNVATSLQIDGSIRADGQNSDSQNSAGGSVWITTAALGGNGFATAYGTCCGWYASGGGAIAIEYTTAQPGLTMAGHLAASSGNGAGAGSIYVRGPGATFGTLTIENNNGSGTTKLPSLGSGTAQAGTSGATLVTGTANVQGYFAGHWVEITDAATGTLKGTWRIDTVTPNSGTVTLKPNGTETISLAAGDKWQGVYRFDTVVAPHGDTFSSVDPVRLGASGSLTLAGPTTSGQWLTLPTSADGLTNVTITGNVALPGITATNITLHSGSNVSVPRTTPPTTLTITASNMTIESGAAIDVTGRGYNAGVSYPNETIATNNSGASHIGQGAYTSPGTTYGSVYQPQEPGSSNNSSTTAVGGGVVRMNITTLLQNDGVIRANGQNSDSQNSAGGSVWITTAALGGTGSVTAYGTCCGWYASGGGAIAVEYTSAQAGMTMASHLYAWSGNGAGAGSVYVKGPDATFGSLTVDNNGGSGTTKLPSLGNGIAQTGTGGATLVTGKANVQGYFAAHWVEISDATTGALKGTWRIDTVTPNSGTVTLKPNGTETISLSPGDKWQGVYRFDTVSAPHGDTFTSVDPVRLGANGSLTVTGPTTSGQWLTLPAAIDGLTNVTINGNVAIPGINATNITLHSGSNLSVPRTTPPTPLTINASNMTIESGAAIDVTGRGYNAGVSYPNETIATNNSGASHIGQGAYTSPGTTYGSVYQPQEPGSSNNSSTTAVGGGVVRMNITTVLQNDGVIRANGQNSDSQNSAGGSVWITTTALGGTGSVTAYGTCCGWYASGGGAIAVEYTSAQAGMTMASHLYAWSGNGAGAGSVYVKGPDATFGSLTVDNNGGSGTTKLPSLGNGTAQTGTSGATLVTGKANVQAYFAAHWVEISDATTGALKGTWRIDTVTPNSGTVTLKPNGTETISLSPGDKWQGVYRFDTVSAPHGDTFTSVDPVRLGANGSLTVTGPTTSGQWLTLPAAIDGLTNVTINGNVAIPGITATNITLHSGSNLSVPRTTPPTTLTITASNMTIESGAAIDVTGRGYAPGVSYPNETIATNNSGASHIGQGAYTSPGTTYGSVYQPQEPGSSNNSSTTAYGGGVVRLNVTTLLQNDGVIRANGQNVDSQNSAGGSVWITTSALGGAGSVTAYGWCCGWYASGGGAIAVEYTSAQAGMTMASHLYAWSSNGAGAGSVYVKGPGATFGALTIDNNGSSGTTKLPSLGNGIAQTGTGGATLVTGKANVQGYFAAHWVEISDATTGALKGTWRIDTVTPNSGTVTLKPNGSETISLSPGDKWQGVYRFDTVSAPHGDTFTTVDPLRLGANGSLSVTGPTTSGQWLTLPTAVDGLTTVTINGNVEIPAITATNVTVRSGANLGVPRTNPATTLTINASTVTIESGGAIDVTGRGYAPGVSYLNETIATNNSGASHIGQGAYTSPGTTYGSIYQPQEPGSSNNSSTTAYGGGVVRLNVTTLLQNDGVIRANGQNVDSQNSAGGSVWITTTALGGGGSVTAYGWCCGWYASGGGAIAVEYSSAQPGMTMASHLYAWSSNGAGAGSVYVKGPSATYGALTLDNNNASGSTILPSLGRGFAQAGTSGSTLVTDRSSNIPAYLSGWMVEIATAAGVRKGFWRTAPIAATAATKTLTLVPNGTETISLQQGDQWRGVYRFDSASVIRGATLTAVDAIYTGSADMPAVDATKLSVVSSANGDFVTGSAGAVSDVSTSLPLKIQAISNTTGTAFTGTVNSDGSFSVPVTTTIGDTFVIVATNSVPIPLSTFRIPVAGQVTNAVPVAVVTAQPSSVSPGATVTLTVRLSAAAHSGGTPVALSSSNPSALAVPATLTIPAGNTTASLTITAADPGATTNVVLFATSANVTQSATVTIVSATAALSSVSVTPGAPAGDTSVTGTVTLSGPAPAGGVTVNLATSNPTIVNVPGTVFIAAGSTTASFTADARQAGTAVVTATWGATVSTSVTVSNCSAFGTALTPSSTAMTTVWLDDSLPAGATLTGGTAVTTQKASGTTSITLAGAGPQSFSITGLPTLTPASTNTLVFYALVNPCNPPRQILAVWNDGATDYRASWGENAVDTTTDAAMAGAMDLTGTWVRMEVQASAIGATGKSLRNLTVKTYGGEAWFDLFGLNTCSLASNVARPQNFAAADQVWFDDAVPSGSTIHSSTTNDGSWTYDWLWDATQSVSGTVSHTDGVHAGFHQHFFDKAPAFKTPAGEVMVTYALIDPCNPPREIFLQWNDGSGWEHRAYWGEDLIGGGTNGFASRYRMGPLPAAGAWVRLEVPVGIVGLDVVYGQAFGAYDGRVWFDRVSHASRVNLATGRTATQSSTYTPQPGDAWRAIDGNTSGDVNTGSISITNSEFQPWWQVDLGSVQPIEDVQVWNRTDCCSSRLTDFWLLVSDQPIPNGISAALATTGVSAYHLPLNAQTSTTVRVRRTGRYVRVELTGTTYLQLGEVQVWAPLSMMRTNYAGGARATESTQYLNYYAENAVNGDLNAAYDGEGSISHTGTETDPHWDVDLGAIKTLSDVEVFERSDCTALNCQSQWPNFYVLVSDVPFASNTVAGAMAQSGVGVWYHGTAQVPLLRFPVNRTGRYVRIARQGSNIVTLNEVQVWSSGPNLQPLSKPPENASDH